MYLGPALNGRANLVQEGRQGVYQQGPVRGEARLRRPDRNTEIHSFHMISVCCRPVFGTPAPILLPFPRPSGRVAAWERMGMERRGGLKNSAETIRIEPDSIQ